MCVFQVLGSTMEMVCSIYISFDNQHYSPTHLMLPGEEEVLDHGDPNKVPNLKHVMNPEGKSCSPVKSF